MDTVTRNYYLHTMGIQVWEPREATETTAAIAQTEIIEKSKAIEQPLHFFKPGATLDELRQQVAQCTACDLHKTRTQTVFGVGNPQADLVVIGEAPGFNEDQQGEPFVGRAGQLLDAMLKSIQLDRSIVYIANILKCRPPNNRDPQADEVECCTPFLLRQLELIQPKLILAVGRIASQFLLKTSTPISKLRGQQFSYSEQKIPLFVTFHPAYLLRSPREKAKAMIDLYTVREHLRRVG